MYNVRYALHNSPNPNRTLQLNIVTPITPAMGNVHTNFGLSTHFSFQVRNST